MTHEQRIQVKLLVFKNVTDATRNGDGCAAREEAANLRQTAELSHVRREQQERGWCGICCGFEISFPLPLSAWSFRCCALHVASGARVAGDKQQSPYRRQQVVLQGKSGARLARESFVPNATGSVIMNILLLKDLGKKAEYPAAKPMSHRVIYKAN